VFFAKKVENGGVFRKKVENGGVFCKKVENGRAVFCKEVDLSSTQVHYVQYQYFLFYILLI